MKRIVRWAGIILAVLLVAVIGLSLLIDANAFRPALESQLTAALGREVHVGGLKLSLLSGGIAAQDLSVADDPAFGKAPFLRAKSLSLRIQPIPLLLSRKLNVEGLTIEQPEIALVQSPAGDWNFSSLGGKSAAGKAEPPSGKAGIEISAKVVKISDGRLTYSRTSSHWKPITLEKLAIEVKDFSAANAFPFSLKAAVVGGGTIQLEGQAGPIQPDVSDTPLRASLKIGQLDLGHSGVNDWAPEIAGVVSLEGSAESDGKIAHLKGSLKAEKLNMAKSGTPAKNPVQLEFAADHSFRKHAGSLHDGKLRIGKATARFTGNYAERGESMMLHMDLSGPEMPVVELVDMLPPLGIAMPLGSHLEGGTAVAHLNMEGPADRLVTTGDLTIRNTRLAGFDLGKKMSTIERLAGIKAAPDTDIQLLSANIRKSPEGMNVSGIQLTVPSIGELQGGGTVSPSNAVDFKMSARVHGSGLLAVVGNTAIPFRIEGTSSQMVFRPDVKGMVTEKAKDIGGSLLRGILGGKQLR